MIKELDNIQICDLTILLNENTVLKRFYPLIPVCSNMIKQLLRLGITDKYMFFNLIVWHKK